MLGLLLYLLILVIVAGLLFWLVSMLPLPAPWGTVARVLLVLVFIVLLIYLLSGGFGGGTIIVHDRV